MQTKVKKEVKNGPYFPNQKPPHEGEGWCGCYFPHCQPVKDDPEAKVRHLYCQTHNEYTVPLNGHAPIKGELRVLTDREREEALKRFNRGDSRLTDTLGPL